MRTRPRGRTRWSPRTNRGRVSQSDWEPSPAREASHSAYAGRRYRGADRPPGQPTSSTRHAARGLARRTAGGTPRVHREGGANAGGVDGPSRRGCTRKNSGRRLTPRADDRSASPRRRRRRRRLRRRSVRPGARRGASRIGIVGDRRTPASGPVCALLRSVASVAFKEPSRDPNRGRTRSASSSTQSITGRTACVSQTQQAFHTARFVERRDATYPVGRVARVVSRDDAYASGFQMRIDDVSSPRRSLCGVRGRSETFDITFDITDRARAHGHGPVRAEAPRASVRDARVSELDRVRRRREIRAQRAPAARSRRHAEATRHQRAFALASPRRLEPPRRQASSRARPRGCCSRGVSERRPPVRDVGGSAPPRNLRPSSASRSVPPRRRRRGAARARDACASSCHRETGGCSHAAPFQWRRWWLSERKDAYVRVLWFLIE